MPFHINRNTGRPAVCHAATPASCRNGSAAHFETDGDAYRYLEQMAELELGHLTYSTERADDDHAAAIRAQVSTPKSYKMNSGSAKVLDEHRRAAALAADQTSPLVTAEISHEDTTFHTEGVTTTSRLILEDGTAGYWKSLSAQSEPDEANTHIRYGSTPTKSLSSEVMAYTLCQKLGNGFEDLVPPTVIREHNGEVGTLQAERKGEIYSNFAGLSVPDSYEGLAMDPESLRQAAIFDFLIASDDRHAGNLIVDDDGKLSLIDNSFSFGEDALNRAYCQSFLAESNLADRMELKQEEKAVITKLRESDDLLGMAKYMSKNRADALRIRAAALVESENIGSAYDYLWNACNS